MASELDLLNDGGAELDSVKLLAKQPSFRRLTQWLGGMGLFLIIVAFLPWQQNIQANGEVTALDPMARPQQAVAAVGGRIVRWYVQEGAVVKAGDPIVALTEAKDAYLDPRVLERAGEQVRQKEAAVDAKRSKAAALTRQLRALDSAWVAARVKADNRITQLRATLAAARLEDSLATVQLNRTATLVRDGLQSELELELARQRAQRASALTVEQTAALNTAQAERRGVDAEYAEKIAKVESDRDGTLAEAAEGAAEVAKLQSGRDNLEGRRDLLVVRAPRDGIVVRALRAGVGEVVKEGEAIATIQPDSAQLAVGFLVRARDVPLLRIGDKVRIEFDGWPAVQFSGWPSVAVGTFGGRVAVIDEVASATGSYRVLVEADPEDEAWPDELRIGSGARGWALLRDVTVGFEIWRTLNGFPPALPADAASGGAKTP
jgi:adhesin transport system membrane fusion protein